jgi:hypothetical protein
VILRRRRLHRRPAALDDNREGGIDQSLHQYDARHHFKNDPLIRKALKTFKGQIVEVRA